jgi:peptidoglycan/LPS O-acetylase OafA/YrhL
LLRIFPLYFVVLSVDWIGTRFGSRLITEMSTDSYFRHLLLNEGKSIYWTIPVEVKYYVALPVVALALAVCLRRSLALGVGIGMTAIVAAAVWLWPGDAYRLRTLELGPYLPIFFAGSMSAFIHCWIEESVGTGRRAIRVGLEVCAFAALAAVFAMVPSAWRGLSGTAIALQHFHKDYWLFGLLWAVVVLATVHGAGPLRAIFSAGWLRFIGTVSFSVYLWHVLVLRTVALKLQLDPTLEAWIVIAGALALAAVSYLAIERPFLRFGARMVRGYATPANLNSSEDR